MRTVNQELVSKKEYEKKDLRRRYIRKRKSLTQDYRRKADQMICSQLLAMPALREASLVVGYLSDGYEPDLRTCYQAWLAEGKRCFFPRYNRETLQSNYEIVEVVDLRNEIAIGRFNIPEPVRSLVCVELRQLTDAVWIVPGVGFDLKGNRIGRGKGVYDRLLTEVRNRTVGVFYHCQMAAKIPVSRHDRRLSVIVTEKGMVFDDYKEFEKHTV